MGVLQTIFVYLVACFYGVLVSVRLLYNYIKNPSAFPVKERKEPPKCLTDPENGSHGYLSLKDIKIHYVEKGDRSKTLMLFLHGFPEFWYSWRHQMREFSKDYWTVAIDMRGYGDSGKPPGIENYRMTYLVEDIKQVVEALGRKKFILVAHDWGGAVAWSVVHKYPEMIESYIIMDAPYTPSFLDVIKSNRKQFFASWYMFFYQLPYLPEILLNSFDLVIFPIIFKSKTKKSPPTMTKEDIEAFKYTFCKPEGITPAVNYYRALFRDSESAESLSKKLDIDAPGLFMFGELERYLIFDHMEIAKKYVKKLELKIVKGADHFVQEDEPETVNKYIREFLKSVQ